MILTSQHRPILILQAGDDVELIDPAPTHNYYHVRTLDGVEGWVFAHSLDVTSPPVVKNPSPVNHPVNPIEGVATSIPPNWEKPDPPQTTFDGPDGHCGPSGDGGDTFTNLRKNRTDAPPAFHQVTWKALQSLPVPASATARSLAQWTPQEIAQIQPFNGVPVSVIGYIIKIKVESGGSGESTNCHFSNPEEVDWHVPLGENAGDSEASSIIVETTPRVRKSHPNWTPAKLAPWVGSQNPVRISGWTLLDPEHRAHLGKFRSTLWEVHSIIKIEVFENGEWVDADSL